MVFPSKEANPYLSRRVLLTGAHGFTGAYVRAELEAAGYSVVGTIIRGPAGPNEIELDITSLEKCRSVVKAVCPDYVIHLAAISFVQHADPAAFYRVNVLGTLNLLQALADTGMTPRRVLVASTANVYGNATVGIINESQLPQPVNHYAASKLAMEHLIRTWTDRLPIVVTRPFNYTGVGQAPHFVVPKIVSHFVRNEAVIESGNLDVERDFSDVRTVAHIYRELLECDCAGEVVNVCSGKPYSLRQILAAMEEIAGYPMKVRINQAFIREAEVNVLVGSSQKLHGLIGFQPAVTLRETLQWMYETGVKNNRAV